MQHLSCCETKYLNLNIRLNNINELTVTTVFQTQTKQDGYGNVETVFLQQPCCLGKQVILHLPTGGPEEHGAGGRCQDSLPHVWN